MTSTDLDMWGRLDQLVVRVWNDIEQDSKATFADLTALRESRAEEGQAEHPNGDQSGAKPTEIPRNGPPVEQPSSETRKDRSLSRDRHASKQQMGKKGKRRTTATSDGSPSRNDRRKESSAATRPGPSVGSPAESEQHVAQTADSIASNTRRRKTETVGATPALSKKVASKTVKKEDMPDADASRLRVLAAGSIGEDDQRLSTIDSLSAPFRAGLEEWWRETRVKQRFAGWYRGVSGPGNCAGAVVSSKTSSQWKHGGSHACVTCLNSKRPCCRLLLTDTEHVVVVLPQAGEEDDARFEYWNPK